jgi:hypothetical protein
MKKSRESGARYSFRTHERKLAMKKVDKIGMGRLATSAVSHVVLEFDKLRLGDLPAGGQRAQFLKILMIQHR